MAWQLKTQTSIEAIHLLKSKTEVAILCGGKGTRLGGIQKGSIYYQGERIIDRLSRLGHHLGSRLLWVERTKEQVLDPFGLVDQRLEDDHLGGMVGGVIAALKACQSEWLWTFACDLPLLELHHLIPIVQQALIAEDNCPGIAYIDSGRPQPLGAIWRADCHSRLYKFICSGGSPSTFLSAYGKLVQLDETMLIETENIKLSPLFNVNHPEDLKVLHSLQR